MKKLILITLLFIITIVGKAEIKLPAIISNNMLLQQNSIANIWGCTQPNTVISVTPSWNNIAVTTKSNKEGKWLVKISTPQGGYTPYTLQISDGNQSIQLNNILIGDVWLCTGQSNMEMPMKGFKNQPLLNSNMDILKSKNKNLRLFTVKRNSQTTEQEEFQGVWSEASPTSVREFSATGYYFGRLLQSIINIPVGLVTSAWGGSCIESWMSKDMLTEFPDIKVPAPSDSIKEKNRTPTTLYNAMIYPLLNYSIKGCIWYQGESNYEHPFKYAAMFEEMVKGWRTNFGSGDFPFYYCQIAPFDYSSISPSNEQGGKFNSAYLREAQLNASKIIPNSGMAVMMDIGEKTSIHPMHKQISGERLALLALSKTYKIEGVVGESPTYKSITIQDSIIVIAFDNAPMWITSFGKELLCFEVAGKDHLFYPAKAIIKRSKVEVYSHSVRYPIAVRYAFKDFIIGDLFGTEGLPISSFRSDNWQE